MRWSSCFLGVTNKILDLDFTFTIPNDIIGEKLTIYIEIFDATPYKITSGQLAIACKIYDSVSYHERLGYWLSITTDGGPYARTVGHSDSKTDMW